MSIRISEIFGPTLQGEGALIGQPSIFVRTGGCDFQCSWCDSLHAVDTKYKSQWQKMSAAEIFTKIEELSGGVPLMVSLSGGNPAIHPLGDLIRMGQEKGYRFTLETQGSIAQDWFADLDILMLSPKPPSSAMKTDWAALDDCVKAAGTKAETALKVVVFDDVDYAYAREVGERYPGLPLYLQAGNHTPPKPDNNINDTIDMDGITSRLRWLADKVTTDRWFSATVLPQLHVMMWGNLRGV